MIIELYCLRTLGQVRTALRVQVPSSDKAAAILQFETTADFDSSSFEDTWGGLTVKPDLTEVGAALLALPDEFPSHPLDMTPKDLSDGRVLTVRQFIFLLQHCGFVGTPGTPDRTISCEKAVRAVRRACFPSEQSSFMVRQPNRHHVSQPASSTMTNCMLIG
jgi:hypothetical protein